MKLIITRIGIRKEKQNQNRPFTRMKTKVLTVLAGTALTLTVCLTAEQLPETVPASAEMSESGFLLPVICYEDADTALLSEDLDLLVKAGAETVTCSDVISMVMGMEEIPEKPVLLLFSGSDREIFTDYVSVLEEKKAKGNVVICGCDADLYANSIAKTDEAKLSWNEIRSLERSALIETVSGGYALCQSKQKLNSRALREDLLTMQTRMNEELFHDASVFACSGREEAPKDLLKELGFLMVLEEGDEINHIDDADDLFSVEYIRRGTSPAADFFELGQ